MASSPWGKIEATEPVNLTDIMSEQLANDLQAKENKIYKNSLQTPILEQEDVNETPCESDEVIAMMLQKQFDKEYDEMLKRTENKFNGSSKVSISYANYRRSESAADSDSDEELVDILDRKDWDRFDKLGRSLSSMPRCGYMKENGNMVTKHDSTLTGRKNTCKLMSFPPEFHTGDGAGFDLQLSNKVFNSLKAHSHHEQARRHRIHDKREDRATAEFGVDEFTRLLLYKLINNGLLERVNGVISTGKEAVILHADCDQSYEVCALPKECVIKVFKTTLSEFKQRDKYIKDDYRFKDRYGSKQNSRKMVTLWAEKEMHNLSRLQKAGIPCPEVLSLKKHILVMSFIGDNHRAAAKLKDAKLDYADMVLAYEQVLEAMKRLYCQANLVHADLSEYNILWHDSQCWFIDVGQSVEPSHPNAHMFLYRDCSNVSMFFTRKGVPEVKDPDTLFTEITGFQYHSEQPTTSIKDNQKVKPHLVDRPDLEKPTNFEFEWEKSRETNTHIDNIASETNNLILVEQQAS